MEDSLHERGKAMEDLYFQQKDQQLLAKLKADLDKEEGRKSLERATGISDRAILDKMLATKISAESMLAVSLIPLVAVAWADGSLESGEKDAILQAADIAGIDAGTVAHQTLAGWLSSKPGPELLQAWEAYVKGMKLRLEAAVFNHFKSQVLERAETIAKSAGGFLGMGNKISDVEREMLKRLTRAFG